MTSDFLIIGGGVVGLGVSLELKRRFPEVSVTLVEKEDRCGIHASSRNSGVLHAGFYYASDSLKAQLTARGNAALTEYCLERGLPINRCGKLVVAQNEAELDTLDELFRRARTNGVDVRIVSAEEAREIEPGVTTVERALFSPTTSSVDPGKVVASLADDAARLGVRLRVGTAYRGRDGEEVSTTDGAVSAGMVINAAGVYADRVARDFGFGTDYTILPFKGLYLYQNEGAESTRTHVYPVPDLAYPWLGVHLTVTVDGRVKIGPTATPAFWREHYTGFENFKFHETLEIVAREAGLFVANDFGFRALAFREWQKYSRSRLADMASGLARGVSPGTFRRWGRPGIRAQLLNVRTRKLEMDFRVEGDERSVHILNAVSPAFTCTFSFASHLVDHIESASPFA